MSDQSAFLVSIVRRLKVVPPFMKNDKVADEMALETGVWYRLFWYKDDHLLWPGTDHAICGKTLTSPLHDAVYDVLYAEGIVVRGLVFESERKGNKCSECNTVWKKRGQLLLEVAAEDAADAASVREMVEATATMSALNPVRRMEEIQLLGLVQLVRRELGGELV